MKTGVVGLGAMGSGMALNLHKAGHLVTFWNRSPVPAQSIEQQTGLSAADSPSGLAEQCELIITCVSRDADVLDVLQQLLPGIKPGTTVVDTSTVSAQTAIQASQLLEKAGATFLDAPVSGGKEGAQKGTLAMMVGGNETVLTRIKPTLDSITSKVRYMGPTGSGQATKAVNQIVVAGIAQAVSEGLAFGQAMGLDMENVIDVISGGAAGNWFLEHRGPTMIRNSFEPGFKLALHHKDLTICHNMAKEKSGVALQCVEQTLADYETLMAEGFGDEDISSLFRLKQKLFDE